MFSLFKILLNISFLIDLKLRKDKEKLVDKQSSVAMRSNRSAETKVMNLVGTIVHDLAVVLHIYFTIVV